MCQQQSRSRNDRKVYTAHSVGSPQVSSLSNKGGCVIGSYRPPTTLGHSTKPGRCSSYLIHKNKHREAATMRRQRNMAQVKEQNKTPQKELNKMERNNLLDAEFKTLVIRMLKELSENLNSINKIQPEMKDTLILKKNNL